MTLLSILVLSITAPILILVIHTAIQEGAQGSLKGICVALAALFLLFSSPILLALLHNKVVWLIESEFFLALTTLGTFRWGYSRNRQKHTSSKSTFFN